MSGKTPTTTVVLPLGLLVCAVALALQAAQTRAKSAVEKEGTDDGGLVMDTVESRSIVAADAKEANAGRDVDISNESTSTTDVESSSSFDTDSVSDLEDDLVAESPTGTIEKGEMVEEEARTTEATETVADADERTETTGIVSTDKCREIAEQAIAKPVAAEEDGTRSTQFQKKEEIVVVVGGGGAAAVPVPIQQDQERQLRAFLAKTDEERLRALRAANIRTIDDVRQSRSEDLARVVPVEVARRLVSYASEVPGTD